MRLASRRRRRDVGLILVALFVVSLAACAPGPSPNSPEVDEMYRQMYRPIIDGDGV